MHNRAAGGAAGGDGFDAADIVQQERSWDCSASLPSCPQLPLNGLATLGLAEFALAGAVCPVTSAELFPTLRTLQLSPLHFTALKQ